MMDWTVAMDAILTQRLCRCMACGHTATGWWGMWQEYGVIVAYVRCERCHGTGYGAWQHAWGEVGPSRIQGGVEACRARTKGNPCALVGLCVTTIITDRAR